MNYSEMTDNDVAKAVVMAMGGREMCDGVFLCENKRYDIDSPQSNFNFDPCNSWADAGPIIAKNCIGIMPFQNKPAKAWATSAGLLSNMYAENESPLRAAMIVFLMMQGKSNA